MDGRRSNRVLIIGARGVLGALTARAFATAGWQVRRAVRRPGPGEVFVDLDQPDSVAAALAEDELVVNTVPHEDLIPERIVLDGGGALVNTSALPASAGRSLRAVAGAARGTVLMNAGLAPGVTTIVAAELLRLHPAADELELVFTLSATSPRGPASGDFLYRGLTAVTRHRTVIVPLPQPFGERSCVGFGEGDAGWLGGVAEGRVVRVYVCVFEPDAHQRLLERNSAGTMTALPRSLIAAHRPERDGTASTEPVAHWIAANRGGRRLAARTVRCRGDFLHAAQSTVLFGQALRAEPPRAGCFDPEEICTLAGMQAQLLAAGITVVVHPGPPCDRAQ